MEVGIGKKVRNMVDSFFSGSMLLKLELVFCSGFRFAEAFRRPATPLLRRRGSIYAFMKWEAETVFGLRGCRWHHAEFTIMRQSMALPQTIAAVRQ